MTDNDMKQLLPIIEKKLYDKYTEGFDAGMVTARLNSRQAELLRHSVRNSMTDLEDQLKKLVK